MSILIVIVLYVFIIIVITKSIFYEPNSFYSIMKSYESEIEETKKILKNTHPSFKTVSMQLNQKINELEEQRSLFIQSWEQIK